ncbi:MAG: replication-associated recombination protein A, partial [Nitrospinae bacterium]|nr:replication-associated recombination protein A [Nitrospinota bacterium]
LKDTHYSEAKAAYGYGVDYKYPQDYPGNYVRQNYLPEALKNRKYVDPSEQDKKE